MIIRNVNLDAIQRLSQHSNFPITAFIMLKHQYLNILNQSLYAMILNTITLISLHNINIFNSIFCSHLAFQTTKPLNF